MPLKPLHAARAAEELRRSRAACMTAPVSTPTWTGHSGGAGAPGGAARRRFGIVSRSAQLQPQPQAQARVAIGGALAGTRGAGAVGSGSGALGSGALITQMRERRQQLSVTAETEPPRGISGGGLPAPDSTTRAVPAATVTSLPSSSDAQLLMARLVSFLEACGGSAATGDIVAHFRGDVPESRMPVFRQVCMRVHVLDMPQACMCCLGCGFAHFC